MKKLVKNTTKVAVKPPIRSKTNWIGQKKTVRIGRNNNEPADISPNRTKNSMNQLKYHQQDEPSWNIPLAISSQGFQGCV
jgi:hypothetical protein